jgi:hypothetical protein
MTYGQQRTRSNDSHVVGADRGLRSAGRTPGGSSSRACVRPDPAHRSNRRTGIFELVRLFKRHSVL